MTGTVRTAIVSTACLTMLGMLSGPAGPASAAEPRQGGTATSVTSPYAVPLAALGGQTLAEYLAIHQAAATQRRPTVSY